MLISILIVSVSFAIGKCIAKIFIIRDLFFKEMLSLCNFIKTNICFSKNKIQDIMNEYLLTIDKKFYGQVEMLKNIVCLYMDANQIVTSQLFYFLSQEEKAVIVKFVSNFGGADDVNEMAKINEFMNYLEDKKNEVAQKRKVNAPLAYKISVAIGVVICIIII